MQRENVLWFLLVGLLVVVLWSMSPSSEQSFSEETTVTTDQSSVQKNVRIGDVAPEFTLPRWQGSSLRYESGPQSMVVLLHFWASWCENCHLEAPRLVALSEQYASQVRIIGVNIDASDDATGIEAYVQRYKPPYAIVLDEDQKMAHMYQVQGIPCTVIIDRQGIVRERIVGHLAPKILEQRVQSVIQQSP